jgi:hypothetical protein
VVLHKQQSMQQLRSFAAWLPPHAQLVRSISTNAHLQLFDLLRFDFNHRQFAAMGQQVHDTLRGAAAAAAARVTPHPPALAAASAAKAAPAVCGSAAIAALVHPQQQQQRQRWRLASFSCDLPGAAGMLDALPAHSLTRLELSLTESRGTSLKGLVAALARLTNLQQLKLVT